MLRIGLLLLVLPGLALMAGYLLEQSAVDTCLGGGGSWNYATAECDASGSHPFVPFSARHGWLVNAGMLLSLVGLLCCIAGLYRRRG